MYIYVLCCRIENKIMQMYFSVQFVLPVEEPPYKPLCAVYKLFVPNHHNTLCAKPGSHKHTGFISAKNTLESLFNRPAVFAGSIFLRNGNNFFF